MRRIKDYTVAEQIDETLGFTVFSGHRQGDSTPVTITWFKDRNPTASDTARFVQKHKTIQKLDLDGIVKIIEIIQQDDQHVLISEAFDGVSIDKTLRKGPFDIQTFLNIGLKLSETLGNLHKQELTHEAIKPRNVFINTETKQVEITNFGVSSFLTKENDDIYHSEVLESTLPYISPEQTARVNRSVDYRTDLYSLGILFYEMLIGKAPFLSADPMEIIYSHIAISPTPPGSISENIPQMISRIIQKLLMKAAEERYQNAFGLMADLKECQKRYRNKTGISHFALAQKDRSNRFIIPQKLYGREGEIAHLLSLFEEVRQGKGQIALIAGKPGIGKSALVHEIQKSVVTKRGYFISGKYERFRRDVPYSSIIQAYQNLIGQILAENEQEVEKWKGKLMQALGKNARVITDVIPNVQLIIGEQPSVPELGAEDSANRFVHVLEKFVRVFPQENHPVVLFLDDLQWADLASLQLIEKIICGNDIKHFFIIGTYRDDEVTEEHPLMIMGRNLSRESIQINRINLKPLDIDAIIHLLTEYLHCPHEESQELGELIHTKTGGNPFFVIQILKILFDDKLIELDKNSVWQWHTSKIREMRVTDNLVDLLVGKINKLSKGTRETLKISACIGNRFDLETVAVIQEIPIDETLANFTEAISEGLVTGNRNLLIFHHDRIQEAAYSLIPDRIKGQYHYKIGKLALEKTTSEAFKKQLFYIVDQLNEGSEWILDDAERVKLIEMNLQAGKKANASAAFYPASKYFNVALKLHSEDSWEKQYKLTLDTYSQTIETAYLNGEFDRLNYLADMALERVRNVVDTINILSTRIKAYTAQQNFGKAIEAGVSALNSLGVDIPSAPDDTLLGEQTLEVMQSISGKTDADLIDQADMTNPEMLSAIRILADILSPSYQSASGLSPFIILQQLKIHLTYGNHPLAAYAYANYGIILIVGMADIDGGYRFGKLAFKIIDKYNAQGLKSDIVYLYNLFIRHWKEDDERCAAAGLEAYQIGIEAGSLSPAAFGLMLADTYSVGSAVKLTELERNMAEHHKMIDQIHQRNVINIHGIWWQMVINLLGKSDTPTLLVGTAIDETKLEKELLDKRDYSALCNLYSAKFQLYNAFEEFSNAYEYIVKAERYAESVQGTLAAVHINFFGSIIRLINYPSEPGDQQDSILKKVTENQALLKKWSDATPTKFLYRYYLVEAESARISSDIISAMDHYEKALDLCEINTDPYGMAIASELAARFYISIDKKKIASIYMTTAFNWHFNRGAKAVTKHLENNYSEILASLPIITNTGSPIALNTGSQTSEKLDVSTVIKASQAISGEIVLENLLSKMMRIAIENAGAEKGYLILLEGNKLLVEAEASPGIETVAVLSSIPIENHQGLSVAVVNYVARTKEPLLLGDAAKEGGFTKDSYITAHQTKSILCLPILNQGRLFGILYLENNLSIGTFTSDRLELLSIISSQVAISIENARHYSNLEHRVKERTIELEKAYQKIKLLALTDPLTNLSNRRDMLEKIESEKTRRKRGGSPLSLVLADIDDFKKINDTHGHEWGDYVLVHLANLMKSIIRKQDSIARWGGEEFLFLLPETDQQGAVAITEKVRQVIAKTAFKFKDQTLMISMTFGVCTLHDNSIDTDECLRNADSALYEGKNSGKNRVVAFSEKSI